MHDARKIRRNLDAFAAAMAQRGVPATTIEALASADAAKRAAETRVQILQRRRKEAARRVADAQRTGEGATTAMDEGRAVADLLPAAEAVAREAASAFDDLMARLPNVAADDVPVGANESDNVILKVNGEPFVQPWARPHWDFGPTIGLDTEAGANLAGARFAVLRGATARLERALGQWMLDLHVDEHGYVETAVPHMVRPEVMRGTGQLPKFEEDLFRVDAARLLIPTAEVPLTNLVRGRTLDPAALPLRMTALTPCYRAEAGAAGRDTRGYMRQHQFWKVELVSVVSPEDAAAEHERMTRCAETVLERLGLPYRRVLLCTGDMGFSAARTFDLEVWMPGQRVWREISSCSFCGDFQARRMGTRLRGRDDLPHTLNGSGVAVGRALAAVLENGLREDGSVRVPEVLRPYMGGIEAIGPTCGTR